MAAKKTTKKASSKLHYDKDALMQEYEKTFPLVVKAMSIVVAFGLVYFFIMAVYLGGWSHTPHEDFVEQFAGEDGRIEIEYDGLKLPINGGKTIEEQKAELGKDH